MMLCERFKVTEKIKYADIKIYAWRRECLPSLIYDRLYDEPYYRNEAYELIIYYETKEDAYKALSGALDKLELNCYRSFEYFSKDNLKSLKSAIEREIDKRD